MPYTGRVGKLLEIKPGTTQIIKGVRARAAVVQLENEQKITLPLSNLDVVE